ncbi:DUF952 domain-containing protein [Actinomadura parmotrematis]|uniref:DUF952 domain-containing protein n=1 Tax=Actinomadura parmotrematis TaxID=2864039 RepID=A0ABS7G2S9_9ACTN|nr:DUF952 domain-containing protein [Actinomadura parmotrematis]MBW8486992.1 DUF952 domain-containing protein [Actinomadura parmotrematis]
MSSEGAREGAGTLLHIAERRYWEEVRASGAPYAMSTRGRTLAEEGFVHCSSSEEQVAGVLSRFYADVPPAELVLLVLDAARLGAPVRHEAVGDGVFPHVYGPLPLEAVIDVRPLPRSR